MKETFKELIAFTKNPVLEKDENVDVNYRFSIFLKLLIICLATGFIISPFFSILEYLELVNLENHASEEMMKNFSTLHVFFFTVILAPLIEELMFRAPLTLFKNPKSFKIAFYVFALLFGFIHILNFEINLIVLLLSPILVLVQILLGFYLGFIRIKFGLQWSILLHAAYNGILITLSYLFDFQ